MGGHERTAATAGGKFVRVPNLHRLCLFAQVLCDHIWTFGFGFIYVKVMKSALTKSPRCLLRCPNHQEQVSTCLVDLLLQLPRTVYCDGVCIHSEPIGSRITRPIDRTFKNARRKSCRFLFAPALSAWTPPTAALSKASESSRTWLSRACPSSSFHFRCTHICEMSLACPSCSSHLRAF
jgi:hypothetical protein